MSTVDSTWETALAESFGGLRPAADADGAGRASGTLRRTALGGLGIFDVCGTPQSLQRTRAAVGEIPLDLVKICIQRSGTAIVRQGEEEVRIGPGEMTVYDTAVPYALHLTGNWRCTVMTVPRDALTVPWSLVAGAMARSTPVGRGPASVLTHLLDEGLRAGTAETAPAVDERLGAAGLQLLEGALTAADRADAGTARMREADRVRAAVRAWILEHAHRPELSHAEVARAHHLSARSLHRLFETAEESVTQLIRRARLAGVRADLADPRCDHRAVMGVAHRWGFTDQAHLTRAFRAAFGTTPAEYRRQTVRQR